MKLTSESRWVRRSQAWLRSVWRLEHFGRFALYTGGRFASDGCLQKAAGLGYVTLLSLVPLLAIALGVLSAFPAFSAVRADIQDMVLGNFLPETGAAVTRQLTTFVENASKATGPGILAFGLTAILLLNNINAALNDIWRVPDPRPLALRFLVYWALLSLGPLFLGASLSLSSYAFAMVQFSGADSYAGALVEFARLISVALATLGFTLIYFVVPNRAVHLLHALVGGLVAAVLLELLKVAFGLYLAHFASYQAIYGALAAVPIFLVWLYLSWVVILFGAEVAAALPEWRASHARGSHTVGPGEQLALALALLGRLYGASQKGGALRERALVRGLPATPAEIDQSLRKLRRSGVAERSSGGRWLLARDLTGLSLGELLRLLDLHLRPATGWPPAAERAAAVLADAGEAQLARPVAELLQDGDEKGF